MRQRSGLDDWKGVTADYFANSCTDYYGQRSLALRQTKTLTVTRR